MTAKLPPGRHVRLEHQRTPESWFDVVFDLWRDWTYNIGLALMFTVGSTVCVGIPVGLFAKSQTFVDGLVIGALLGMAVFGLVSCVLSFVVLTTMVFEAVRWTWKRIGGRKPAGS